MDEVKMAPDEFGEGVLGVVPGVARQQFPIGVAHVQKNNVAASSDPPKNFIVRGTYAERLRSIKKGLSVDELYRLIGAAMPYRYRRDAIGKWRVVLVYQGAGRDFWNFEADAASGTILNVSVSSI